MSPSLLNIFDLKEILEKIFIEFFENNKQLFLVDLDVDSFKIDVKIDGDNGVKVSDCVLLSKHIKKHFDTELDDFSLNVSSAGLLSPLITYRQFLKNLKRKLNVTLREGDDIKGNLIKVSEEDITLEWTAREPKPVGKGKVTVKKNKLIAFDEIKKAKLVVEFNKI